MAEPFWWPVLYLLQEPSYVILIGTACGVVLLSAVRALEYELSLARLGIHQEDASVTITGKQAALLPLLASGSLLAVFFFFSSIQHLMLVMMSISSVAAIAFVLQPVLKAAAGQSASIGGCLHRHITLHSCGGLAIKNDQMLLGCIGVSAVLCWLLTGAWLLNNVLGVCFCMAFISFIRLPNLKVCAVLLGGLFVYDVFWVFFSEGLFGDNVMVAAATKQADNPVRLAAEALHIPVSQSLSRQLDLPVKLLFPRSIAHPDPQDALMLGLGDMALPGLLLSLLLCSDFRRAAKRELPGSTSGAAERGLQLLLTSKFWREGYTGICWGGYCIGIVLALSAGAVFQAAQPALLYLVPCTLLPVAAKALAKGEWAELWGGQRMQLFPGKHEMPEEEV